MYTSSSVDHQNILKFIGHDEKEMRLVVALHTRGSVYTVIQRQVLTLAEFQLLGKSISCGEYRIADYFEGINFRRNAFRKVFRDLACMQ